MITSDTAKRQWIGVGITSVGTEGDSRWLCIDPRCRRSLGENGRLLSGGRHSLI